MTDLAAIIEELTKIAKMDDVDMRTELGFYVRELEQKFQRLEQELESEFDNVPI